MTKLQLEEWIRAEDVIFGDNLVEIANEIFPDVRTELDKRGHAQLPDVMVFKAVLQACYDTIVHDPLQKGTKTQYSKGEST